MSPEQRKRVLERMILGMVYDVDALDRSEQRERPDFALWMQGEREPVGVEITQIFPSESHARLNLLSDYMKSLWEGSPHRHKKDVKVLQVIQTNIFSPEGELKAEGVPAIITRAPTIGEFKDALVEAISTKSMRGYPPEEFRHINLVILDWFHLPFKGDDFSSDRFFTDRVRELLINAPFREIYLVLEETGHAQETDGPRIPRFAIVRLQQLLLAEQLFLTGQGILRSSYADSVRDGAHLMSLIGDYLVRIKGMGCIITERGSEYVCYRGTAAGISKDGSMSLLDYSDFSVWRQPKSTSEFLSEHVAQEIEEFLASNAFSWGFSEPVVQMPSDFKPSSRMLQCE